VFFQGAAGVLVSAGTSVPSDETSYPLDEGQDLIVAFDVGTPGFIRRRSGVPGARQYQLANSSEAAVPDRTSGDGALGDTVAIVEKIEVVG
jgi:hypothetical protein